jgi:hypothetical protein
MGALDIVKTDIPSIPKCYYSHGFLLLNELFEPLEDLTGDGFTGSYLLVVLKELLVLLTGGTYVGVVGLAVLGGAC